MNVPRTLFRLGAVTCVPAELQIRNLIKNKSFMAEASAPRGLLLDPGRDTERKGSGM